MALDLLDRFTPFHAQPTSVLPSAIAPLVLVAGHPALRFPTGSARTAYFGSVLSPLYAAAGITVRLVWRTAVADVTKYVTWSASFERHEAGVFNFAGASSFASGVTVTAYALAAASLAIYTDITCSNGAAIDNVAARESYRLAIARSASDTVADNAYLYRVFLLNAT